MVLLVSLLTGRRARWLGKHHGRSAQSEYLHTDKEEREKRPNSERGRYEVASAIYTQANPQANQAPGRGPAQGSEKGTPALRQARARLV